MKINEIINRKKPEKEKTEGELKAEALHAIRKTESYKSLTLSVFNKNPLTARTPVYFQVVLAHEILLEIRKTNELLKQLIEKE